MIKAYKLFSGPDGSSFFEKGTVADNLLVNATSVHFKETLPHAYYDWHTAPEVQYVITLEGTLEFTVTSGETFLLQPGDVLLAMDLTGAGHKWQLLGDQPWKRAYVVLQDEDAVNFTPDRP